VAIAAREVLFDAAVTPPLAALGRGFHALSGAPASGKSQADRPTRPRPAFLNDFAQGPKAIFSLRPVEPAVSSRGECR
jgi:hypothetical protein